jgi:hypothetical protein
MVRIAQMAAFVLNVVALLLLGAGTATAQALLVPAPTVSYYCPPPVVSYYGPPVVYTPAPATSYYYGATVSYYPPAVSYYAAPAVSYYAAPAAATTTTYYGLFGRPRVTTTTYSPPVFLAR